MAGAFPIPPTYASPVDQDPATGKAFFSPAWLQYFLDLSRVLSEAGGTSGVNHEALGGLLGGAANDHYHMTQVQQTAVLAAVSGVGGAVQLPAVGASPWTYHNANAYNVFVVASGGTPSDLSVSRDNVTFYSAGAQRAVTLGPGDYLKVTYAAAPTVAVFPL